MRLPIRVQSPDLCSQEKGNECFAARRNIFRYIFFLLKNLSMSKPPSCTPTAVRPGMSPELYSHSPEDVRAGLTASLKALKTDKLALWYLHGPDRGTQFEATLREVDKLHKEGCFERFGICNYYSWEVARICDICEQNGWIKPTVYQGLYNALHRFNPLAGGFLTNRYQRDTRFRRRGSIRSEQDVG